MKNSIKKIVHYCGLFKISSWINRKILKILFYHGISRPKDSIGITNFDEKHLNIDSFEEHLKLITKYCRPISLEQAISNISLPLNPIVVTFDDGYKNNYTYAFPLLKKYKIPATFFVTTGFIDQSHYMWTDRLEFMINNTKIEYMDLLWENDILKLELDTVTKRMDTIRFAKSFAKKLSEPKKNSFLDKLQEVLKVEYEWDKIPPIYLPLSWDDMREMNNDDLISFGSHTVTHPILSKCNKEQQRKELIFSQQRIREELGIDCNLFAYPNGEINDFNQWTVELLKELGYVCAVTTQTGYIADLYRNKYTLNRFGRSANIEDLGMTVTGLSRILGTQRKRAI
jgi:peptidoglycan/xylan/chitin deacetylase (PgdA/CDA1 family)